MHIHILIVVLACIIFVIKASLYCRLVYAVHVLATRWGNNYCLSTWPIEQASTEKRFYKILAKSYSARETCTVNEVTGRSSQEV